MITRSTELTVYPVAVPEILLMTSLFSVTLSDNAVYTRLPADPLAAPSGIVIVIVDVSDSVVV